ncbi:hypothetical protein RFI_20138 [Reticulomyxa filosa]|uniref:Uncharacterized protein n=1 Tax=Reticulomyxa filosa TaxID=46433 RepID=X6MTL7_RETFI|nr:hypothetical protein RFI_20138 [Reticulomyxa filosa]|eukprot:ETO17194.1 hypothetical protein RFI_20138 [Reticulomyxa filosa]
MDMQGEVNRLRQEIREVKSDLAYRSNQPATEQDIADVRNLQLPTSVSRKRDLEETPANSPTAEAHSRNSPTWKNALDPATVAVAPQNDELLSWQSSSDEEEKNGNPGPLLHVDDKKSSFQHRESKMTLAELQSMYDDKAQLVEDLQRHIEALRQSRQTEIKTLKNGMNQMINRSRQWWSKIFERCNNLEIEFQQKMVEMNNAASDPNAEEYKIELGIVRDEFEKFKNQTHYQEQKLHDTLEIKNQHIEQLTSRVKSLEAEKLEGGFGRDLQNREEDDLREEINQLKEMLADQEKEFVAEVEQFEMVANQKLQELERFYRAQIDELNAKLGNDQFSKQQLESMTSSHKEIYEQTKMSLAQAMEQTFTVLRTNNPHAPNGNNSNNIDGSDSATATAAAKAVVNGMHVPQLGGNGNMLNMNMNMHGNGNIDNNSNLNHSGVNGASHLHHNGNVNHEESKKVIIQNDPKLIAANNELSEKLKQLEAENKLLKHGNEDLVNKLSSFQKGFTDKKEKFQQKIQTYEQNYQNLEQQLKENIKALNELQKKTEKSQKTVQKQKNKNKKLKEELKESKKQIQDLESLQTDIAHLKQSFKTSQQEWNTMKEQFELIIKRSQEEADVLRQSKVEYVRQTMVEMNKLRDYIKQLQKQIKELKNSDDTESVISLPNVMGGIVSLFGK